MRFVAPAREAVDPVWFEHLVFAGYRHHRDLLSSAHWPGIDELNRRLAAVTGDVRFVAQDRDLLADGLHYEQRIAARGQVATRPANWHDLFNALVWIEHSPLKRAINARQVADLGRAPAGQRTRGQCALTHFDEAGAIVLLRDPALVAAWDRHDWPALFVDHGGYWRHQVELVVFGHALLEHALVPEPVLVGKCLVAVTDAPPPAVVEAIADAIRVGDLLADPQELRPLPMAGIPGWHRCAGDRGFVASHPCFRPLRTGRVYPAPVSPANPDRAPAPQSRSLR